MQIFTCPESATPVYFDNLNCACGAALGYDPEAGQFVAPFEPCKNRDAIGCNWIASAPGGLCAACTMTRTHPDLTIAEHGGMWARAEAAKRWVLATLAVWGWLRADDLGPRPTFDILGERTAGGHAAPVMGHAEGHVTINAAEADPAEIIRRREEFGEPQRTMVGHFRHEIAHFLFWRLSANPEVLGEFRARFGDERADYGEALQAYYANGPRPDWQSDHITAYAAAHPHEDWAETLAHALLLTDMLESARAAGVAHPAGAGDWVTDALEVGLALNHVNRAAGIEDVYPFVVSNGVRRKLAFAMEIITRGPR
ncbi:MAG: putative zinc-binding metallopeptidase [Pseudomonadota bacterium]